LQDSATAFRRLYAHAADPEAAIPGGELSALIRRELRRAAPDPEPLLDDLVRAAVHWSADAADRFRAVAAQADDHHRRLLVRRAVLGWAPLGLTAGAWLQWLSSPGNADTPLVLSILALYAGDVGVGHPGASRRDAYLGVLRRLRAAENAVPLARLPDDPRIGDAAFRLPAMLLLMSRRPTDFREELMGADLCLRSIGLPPPLALADAEVRAAGAAIDCSRAEAGGQRPAERCRAIVDALTVTGPEPAGRVRSGFGWALAAVRTQADSLLTELRASLDPAYDMAELMRLRAREGLVYHREVVLDDRPLAAWLADCRHDPRPFLDVLARSRLIRPGRSAASPLVQGLVSERGPMFRVFSPDDLTVISRWIDALPTDPEPFRQITLAPAGAPPGPEPLAGLHALLTSATPMGECPRDLRHAYQLLLDRAGGPELRNWCLWYVRGWLARSRYRLDARSVPLPERWPSEGLRPWLRVQHDRHVAEFEETADVPLPPREAVVDDAVQLAPLTLIDGSWLQGFTDYELVSSQIGHSLFAIYWDELGNGEAKLNHPLIYRQVLHGMEVDLPPTASPEFAHWPGFRDESFELPVYWLSIGRFPRTFLPEVLGLDVAMELSGVGGSYRRAAMALRKYGFSTRFVEIHNTIDNVATGHSAWATDAVDTFLAGLPDSPGPGGRAETWERVRAGYRSLTPPDGFLARWAGRRPGHRRRARDVAPIIAGYANG
jgi:hypothetical protein